MAERGEGRLARWSRLKTDGASPDEHAEAEAEVRERAAEPESNPNAEVALDERPGERPDDLLPDPASLPGGIQKRKFVAPMAPLAEPEDGEVGYAAAPTDALAMLQGEVAHDAEPPADPEERELTPEEQEVVDQLPPIESLTKESDFTPFLADKVPEFIRKRAMRALWLSDPFFGFQDGLDDYAENFRVIDKLIDAATESNYQPGKGYDLGEDEDKETDEEDGTEAAEAAAEPEDGRTAAAESPDDDAESDEEPDDGEGAEDAEGEDAEPERLASSSVRKPGDPT